MSIRLYMWLQNVLYGLILLFAGAAAAASGADLPGTGWSGTLSRMPADTDDVVITTDQAGQRSVRLRPRDGEGVTLFPLPLFANVLPYSAPQAFATDRRCTVVQEGATVRLTCSAGPSIAGAAFAFEGFRLPTGAKLQAKVALAGAPGLRAQFTPEGHDADAMQVIGDPDDAIALPALGKGVSPQLVIIAPPQGGEWLLRSVEIAGAEQAASRGDVSA